MMSFGPMIGASAMPPAPFGGGSVIDLTAILPLALAMVGLVAIALVALRRRRQVGSPSTSFAISKPTPLAA